MLFLYFSCLEHNKRLNPNSVIVFDGKYMIKFCVCQPRQAFHPAAAGQIPAFAGGEMSFFYGHGVID